MEWVPGALRRVQVWLVRAGCAQTGRACGVQVRVAGAGRAGAGRAGAGERGASVGGVCENGALVEWARKEIRVWAGRAGQVAWIGWRV